MQGDIGLNAAHMVMELVKDNRKIVDRITHQHIDNFVDLLRKNKNYRYLDLLSVLCVCDGVSIPDNQIYITETWLMKGQKVGHTDLGHILFLKPLGYKLHIACKCIYYTKLGYKSTILRSI